jgi:hypothetical protein
MFEDQAGWNAGDLKRLKLAEQTDPAEQGLLQYAPLNIGMLLRPTLAPVSMPRAGDAASPKSF